MTTRKNNLRQGESPLAAVSPEFVEKIDLLQTKLAVYSNFYIHFRSFDASALAYTRLKDSPDEFPAVKRTPYLVAAEISYKTLESIKDSVANDSLMVQALDTFKKAYPRLFEDMQKRRRK